jgi:hypothetical protein
LNVRTDVNDMVRIDRLDGSYFKLGQPVFGLLGGPWFRRWFRLRTGRGCDGKAQAEHNEDPEPRWYDALRGHPLHSSLPAAYVAK